MHRDELGVSTIRLLVVDSNPQVLDRVAALGLGLLIDVMTARSAAHAIEQALMCQPDVALLDAGSTESEALARQLRELPGCEALPLAFLSSLDSMDSTDELSRRVAAVHAGASLFLRKPLEAESFGVAMHQLTAGIEKGRAHVLVVDDDAEVCAWVAAVLGAGIRTSTLCDPSRVLSVMADDPPDLILLDGSMPTVSGLDVCRMLRADQRWQDLPVLCLTADGSRRSRLDAFEAGADDYLVKPVVALELHSRVKVRIDRARLRRERAEKDTLTGLLLRRGFLEQVSSRLAQSHREQRMLSVSLIDLDDFKRINDTYGHFAGDRVLASLGQLITCRFRTEDVRARWGGEEFAVAFPGQPPETVAAVLGRVLAEFSCVEFRGDRGELFRQRFSAGVASYPSDGATLEALLRAADRRLYHAKRAGRGRIVLDQATTA